MISDLDLVRLCVASYEDSFKWDRYWPDNNPEGICAGLKDNNLVFRGSVTPRDWFRDFVAFPHFGFNHPQLGLVHAGFDEGMDGFFEEAAKFLRPGFSVSGHSLGAAHAWLMAGRCVAAGCAPARIVTIGSPKPGCGQLRELMKDVSKASYCNGPDPVCDVPIWEPALPVVPPCDYTTIKVIPPDPVDIFAYHHPQFYERGVQHLMEQPCQP